MHTEHNTYVMTTAAAFSVKSQFEIDWVNTQQLSQGKDFSSKVV
jgi:hypothetical protein